MNMIAAHLILGIDGGGTGCRAALCDLAGTPLGQAKGGAANYTSDPAATLTHVRLAAMEAAADAGLTSDVLTRCTAHVGLAGVMTAADQAAVAAALPFGAITVSDDRLTTAVGALGPRDGALAAVGTGSFVAVRRGESIRYFGGWGLRVGDQASGAWLGRGALETCLLVHDGLAPGSDLIRDLMAHFDNDPVQIVNFARTAQPRDHAGFARQIIDAAAAGDAHGLALMQAGAAYLADCFAQADLRDGDVITLSGGIGPHYASYLGPDLGHRIAPPQGTALDGAVRLARDLAAQQGKDAE
ncbi:BadF/BadG/BcrA/BcrD ATPase family protein [Thalassococcus sp. BH17M4-6]|uniref:BadF/BadG/BcrA/BcrD ATPase family protein n=1 Tax=Thalassococcus sp. BH17M4-6 TaxID=3413148 RepID=UPI003BCCF301